MGTTNIETTRNAIYLLYKTTTTNNNKLGQLNIQQIKQLRATIKKHNQLTTRHKQTHNKLRTAKYTSNGETH